MPDTTHIERKRDRLAKRLPSSVQDHLIPALAAAITSVSAGIAAALASGNWRLVLASAAVVALLLFLVVLSSDAFWHRRELEEVGYRTARDNDAIERKLAAHERDNRKLITEARERPGDAATQRARVQGLLERQRKHINAGRPGSIELLVLGYGDGPDTPSVEYSAGSFDQGVLADPEALTDLLESLKEREYQVWIRIDRRPFRYVGISPEPGSRISESDQVELQRAGTDMQLLMQTVADAQRDAGEDEIAQ